MKTSKEVCAELRIPYYRLDYIFRNRLIREPQKLASGQRIFTDADVLRLKEKLFEMDTK